MSKTRQIAETLKVAEDNLDYTNRPQVIYLEPEGGDDSWCSERNWEDAEMEGELPAKYVRADLYLALEARCARYQNALNEIEGLGNVRADESGVIARAALKDGGRTDER